MNLPKLTALLATAASCAATSAFGAVVLYNQPVLPDGTGYASQNDTAVAGFGSFATAYDNFSLASAAAVSEVRWTGQHWNGVTLPGTISEFLVTLYANNAGQPGALLATATIPGNANQTLVSGQIYTYSALLPGGGFSVSGGTTYWLGVQAAMDFPPQWGWVQGTGGEGSAVQDFLGARETLASDLAFSLYGTTAVPEPGQIASGLVILLGAVGYGIRLRKAAK